MCIRDSFTTELTDCLDNVEVVFSAVGTPPDEDGSADLKYVLEVARTVGRNIKKYTVLVTKSTVPVGTAQKVKAVIQMCIRDRVDSIAVVVEAWRSRCIVCGDFNDTPMSYVYRTMAKGLNDAFSQCGSGYSHTFRGFFNTLRIDYVLSSAGFDALSVSYTHLRRCATGRSSGRGNTTANCFRESASRTPS